MKILFRWLAVAGLVTQLAGSAILIFYGTAGHISTGGHPILLGRDVPDKTAILGDPDALYEWLNRFGFMLIVAGTAAQIVDAVRQAKSRAE